MHTSFLSILSLALALVGIVSAGEYRQCQMTRKGCPKGTQFVNAKSSNPAEALRAAINTEGCSHVWIDAGTYDFNTTPLDIEKSMTLIGSTSGGQVLIKGALSSTNGEQNRHTSIVRVHRGDFRAYGIDISNTIDDLAPRESAPGVAIFAEKGTTMGLYGCKLSGWQDTLFCGGRCFLSKGSVSGSVDYLYGYGRMWMQGVGLYNKRCAGSAIAAWDSQTSGGALVVQSARITGAPTIQDASCYLARPWRPQSDVTYFNCYMENINPAGWKRWNDELPGLNTFREFGSRGLAGNTSGRNKELGRQLSTSEVNSLTVTKFFKGDVKWIDSSEAVL